MVTVQGSDCSVGFSWLSGCWQFAQLRAHCPQSLSKLRVRCIRLCAFLTTFAAQTQNRSLNYHFYWLKLLAHLIRISIIDLGTGCITDKALHDRRPSVPRRCGKNLEQSAIRSDVFKVHANASDRTKDSFVFRLFFTADSKVTEVLRQVPV